MSEKAERIRYQGILPGCEGQFSVFQYGLDGGACAVVTQEEPLGGRSLEDLKKKLSSQNEFFQTESLFNSIGNPVISALLKIAELDPDDPVQKRKMDELINGLREGNFQNENS